MKVIKQTEEYTVYQKRSGRYGVKGADGKAINEEAKVAILLAEDLIKAPAVKAPEPEPEVAEEAEAPEADAEEASSEEAAPEA